MLDRDLVENTMKLMLGRQPSSEQSLAHWRSLASIEVVIAELAKMDEFIQNTKALCLRKKVDEYNNIISNYHYFRPIDLARANSDTPVKALLIGSCFVEPWVKVLPHIRPGSEVDFHLVNNSANVAAVAEADANQYTFQVVHVPLRFLAQDEMLNRFLSCETAGIDLINSMRGRLGFYLDNVMTHNTMHGLQTFLLSLIVPQFNSKGRLLGAHGTETLRGVFELLNREMEEIASAKRNCYFIDIDAIASSYGKRYFMDDSVFATNHASFMADYDYARDLNRIEPPIKSTIQYATTVNEFIEVMWGEILAAQATLEQRDTVKLVVTDLDDTLWKGIIGEQDSNPVEIEGWPLGYIEALLTLKGRGILLGIISKNSEETVRSQWSAIVGRKIFLSDFAAVRINWDPKVENMRDILADVNLLPKNVVYIDDNPVERASMQKVFPDMRVLGSNPYTVKRVLLLSPETQVAVVTDESKKRTEMIQAQSKRNSDMKAMSRDDFLLSLSLKVRISIVANDSNSRFARAFELINKTNQFNTNGRRWSQPEMTSHFKSGGYLVVFEVADIYTAYGLVGVLIVSGRDIMQFVMSCRVIGLEVETTVARYVAGLILQAGYSEAVATVTETAANIVCRDIYQRSGFLPSGDAWTFSTLGSIEVPPHITLEVDLTPVTQTAEEAQ